MSEPSSAGVAGASPGLAARTLRGTAWNVVTFGISKGVLLLTTVVLARVLPPEDFGLVALGLLAIIYLDVLGDVGVGAAVIYRRETDPDDASTAVLLAAGTGALLTGATVLVAPAVAGLFGEPELTPVLQVLAGAFLVRQLGVVQRRKLEKDLDFSRRLVPEVVGAVVKGAVSIGLALGGLGVWSLVWGQTAGTAVSTLLYWLLARWRFRWTFDTAVAKELLRFGVPVTVLGLLATVIQTLDVIIIGRRLDAAAVGYYTIGLRLPELLVLQFCYLASQALFPAYAKAREDVDQLRSGFLSTMRLVALVVVPVGLGLAVVAPDLLPLLFGDTWEPSVPVMQLLAVYTVVYSLTFNVGDLYKATGRPGVLNRLAVVRLALAAPALWFAAPYGIARAAAALLAVELVMTSLQLVVAGRLMRERLTTLVGCFLPPAVAGAAMVAVTAGLLAALPDGLPPVARLSAGVLAGALSYAAALAVVDRPGLRRLGDLLAHARGARPAGGRV